MTQITMEGIGVTTAPDGERLVLAIMVIPFVSSVMREVFLTVPGRLKESAYALGATRWEVVWDVVLPYTRSAVIGAPVRHNSRVAARPHRRSRFRPATHQRATPRQGRLQPAAGTGTCGPASPPPQRCTRSAACGV